MSEYIEIESELSDDGRTIYIVTNLPLADDSPEQYDSAAALAEGSPVAQTLAVIEGMTGVSIDAGDITISREPDADWHVIVADVSAALKDFFL